MKSTNPHCERLKQLFNGVAVRVVEITAEICSSEGSEIPHVINEKLRVSKQHCVFALTVIRTTPLPSSVILSICTTPNLTLVSPDWLNEVEANGVDDTTVRDAEFREYC